jgi:NADH-quinone oxidoreductase subunit A
MFIFLGILILGLAYVWRKGDLDWIKPKPVMPTVDTEVPPSVYEKLNKQQSVYIVKEFTLSNPVQTLSNPVQTATTLPPPVRKPMFKPTFKKPGNES